MRYYEKKRKKMEQKANASVLESFLLIIGIMVFLGFFVQ
jgi:hypothetical protein